MSYILSTQKGFHNLHNYFGVQRSIYYIPTGTFRQIVAEPEKDQFGKVFYMSHPSGWARLGKVVILCPVLDLRYRGSKVVVSEVCACG